jgi:chromosome partitioning protein
MYRLLIWTSKGGTGKTTTVANLGPELARLGHDVLMVGFDPQGDLETTFGIDEDEQEVTRIEDLLERPQDARAAAIDVEVPESTRRWRGRRRKAGRLRLLACSSALNEAVAGVAQRKYADLDRLLAKFDGEVEIALIDTQGALTPLSHTAAQAADGVLFTMEPGFYEYRALASRLAELEAMRRDDGLTVAAVGVLFVRTDGRSRQMREYREHFDDPEAFGGEALHVFGTHTRQQASVRDHPRLGQPTVIADANGHAASDYRAFAGELAARIALGERPAKAPA